MMSTPPAEERDSDGDLEQINADPRSELFVDTQLLRVAAEAIRGADAILVTAGSASSLLYSGLIRGRCRNVSRLEQHD